MWLVGQQSPSEPSARIQNNNVSAVETSCGIIPWNSLRSAAGNQAFSSSSITTIPKNLKQSMALKKKHQRKEKFADLSQCLDKRFLLSEVRLHLAPHFKIICNLKKSIK